MAAIAAKADLLVIARSSQGLEPPANPAAILRKLGLAGGSQLIVELAPDGAIVLRPASIRPIDIYTDERIAEFLEEDRITPEQEARVEQAIARPRRR